MVAPTDVALSFINLQEHLPSFFPLKNDEQYAIKHIKLDQQEYSLKTMGVFSEEKTWSNFCPIFPGTAQNVVEKNLDSMEIFGSFIKDGKSYTAKMDLTDIRIQKWTGPPMMEITNQEIQFFQLGEVVRANINFVILGPSGENHDHFIADVLLEGLFKPLKDIAVDSLVSGSNEVAGEEDIPVPVKHGQKDLSSWSRSKLEEKIMSNDKKLHAQSSLICKLKKEKRNLKRTQNVSIKRCNGKVTGIKNIK